MNSSSEQIKRLKELLKNGSLTQKEFDCLLCRIQKSSTSSLKNIWFTILTVFLVVSVMFGTCLYPKTRNYLDFVLPMLWMWCSFMVLKKYREKICSNNVKLLFFVWIILTCWLGLFLIGKL